ncbi:MAG: MarR family transcriptional regulator [Myxococcales bacterium]|nr:MarR family transcriptional regulator [Myxococcales bacterium]
MEHRADVGAQVDLLVEYGSRRFVVEYKGSGSAAVVGSAIAQVKQYAAAIGRSTIPIIAVPFMGDVGKSLCKDANVWWFDLSGNAHIVAPGLRILIEGKPNRFVRRGRPSTAFAPKSARVARHLLLDPKRVVRQQDLARETGLDDGFTSRIVRRLVSDGLVDRDARGALRVRDPNLLLDAWLETYDFEKHAILRGHVTARSGEELVAKLAEGFTRASLRHAATGLAAAWLWTGFASFRLASMFVAAQPDEALLREVGFREQPKGANAWLVLPNDEGVFDGAVEAQGIACVHPVQAYVDLGAHPERAKEAADELRTRQLKWGR